MKLIKLSIEKVISGNPKLGVYILVLKDEQENKRLPIIIGKTEANSIAMSLAGKQNYPRPIAHDLFKDLADKFHIEITKVIIYKFMNGVFYSNIVCRRDNEEELLDARTSDAVALSIKCNAPIYVYPSIMKESGVSISSEGEKVDIRNRYKVDIQFIDTPKLHSLLKKAIVSENYEEAAKIRDEINIRER